MGGSNGHFCAVLVENTAANTSARLLSPSPDHAPRRWLSAALQAERHGF